MEIRDMQLEQAEWSKKNFPDSPSYHPLLGVVEEVGELCHAILKLEQGIRGKPEDHDLAGQDAVGDTLIYLMDFCTRKGWDMQEILEKTWDHVKQRDWQKDKKRGGIASNLAQESEQDG